MPKKLAHSETFGKTNMEAFQQEVRTWLEGNCPPSMRTVGGGEDDMVWGGRHATYTNPEAKDWLTAMGSRGWTCPTWPKEYGGGGLSHDENMMLQEELSNISARAPLVSFGISMLGPVLLEYGTEEQKLEHLPKSCAVKFVGARDTASPAPGPI